MAQHRRGELRMSGGELVVFVLVRIPLVVLTLGIYLFMLPGALFELRIGRTYVDGSPLREVSGLGERIGHALVNLLIVVLSVGLATPYASYRNVRFLYGHLRLEDGREGAFHGEVWAYFGRAALCWLLTLATAGLAAPVTRTVLTRYRLENTTFGGAPVRFEGSAMGAAAHMLTGLLLCYVTLGLYTPWAVVRMWRWEAANTVLDAVAVPEPDAAEPALAV